MQRQLILSMFLVTAACGGAATEASPSTTAALNQKDAAPADAAIARSLAGTQRTSKESARDVYRHPRETLEFFGLRENMNVVELYPGTGWYTAVLAPVLAEKGKLAVVSASDPGGPPDKESTKLAKELTGRMTKDPQAFGKVETRIIHPPDDMSFGPDGSADLVLTFRNFHGWMKDHGALAQKIATSAFKVLKSGGTFGVVEHRAKAGEDPFKSAENGYIPEDFIIKTVEEAGFKLAAKSEVNANLKDTKDYPKGVWTLPPTYALKDVDHAKYAAIGESDRATLKFIKP